MKRFARWGLGCSLILFANTAWSQDAKPLWSVDLGKDVEFAKRAGLDPVGVMPPRLQFVGADLVVVGFETDTPNYPRTVVPKGFDFDLLELDSASGNFVRRFALPVVNVNSDVQAIAGGDLLLLAGESLNRMSGSLEVLQTYATPLVYHGGPVPQVIGGRPDLSVVYEGWKMSVVPLGDAVVLQHKNRQQGELTWLNASDLSVQRAEVESEPGTTLDATKDFALISVWSPPYKTEPVSNAVPACPKCETMYVVNDRALLEGMERKYQIVDRDGKEMMHGSLFVRADSFARTMDGSRAAFATGTLSISRSTVGATRTEVVVVDVIKRKELKRITFETPPEPHAVFIGGKAMTIALSPDGHRIAVLAGTKLTCFVLP
jgi:hypothetical protein